MDSDTCYVTASDSYQTGSCCPDVRGILRELVDALDELNTARVLDDLHSSNREQAAWRRMWQIKERADKALRGEQ